MTVLVPRGVHGYSTGTAQAVLDLAPPGARLVFSSGWHISRDSQDIYSWRLKWKVYVLGGLGKLAWAAGDKAISAKPDDVHGQYQAGTGIGLYSEGVGILTALSAWYASAAVTFSGEYTVALICRSLPP